MPAIEVIGYVVPKPRPRLGKGRVFTPRNAELAEEQIRKAWVEAGHGQISGPLFVDVRVFLPRPTGHFGSGRNAAKLLPSAPRWPSVRPDLDNYAKTALDALRSVAYADDGQIVEAYLFKEYTVKDETPGWYIGVWPMEGRDA